MQNYMNAVVTDDIANVFFRVQDKVAAIMRTHKTLVLST